MLFYRVVKFIFKPIYYLVFNLKIIDSKYISKDGPVVIACNHIHAFDPINIVLSTKRPIRYLAKDKHYDKRLTRFFFKYTNCIRVSTTSKNGLAIKEAVDALEKNAVIGIFPEGTRNKSDELLLPFKYGAVSIALKANAMLVPCAVYGDYKFRGKVVVRYGKPFKIDSNMSLEEANKKLKNEVERLLKLSIEEFR